MFVLVLCPALLPGSENLTLDAFVRADAVAGVTSAGGPTLGHPGGRISWGVRGVFFDIAHLELLLPGGHLLGPSAVSGGMLYAGYGGIDFGIALGVEFPLPLDRYPLRLGAQIATRGEFNAFLDIPYQFYSQLLGARIFIQAPLVREWGIWWEAGIPFDWSFRKDTDIHFLTGISLQMSYRFDLP